MERLREEMTTGPGAEVFSEELSHFYEDVHRRLEPKHLKILQCIPLVGGTSVVYALTSEPDTSNLDSFCNSLSNIFYIGQSDDPEQRFANHLSLKQGDEVTFIMNLGAKHF